MVNTKIKLKVKIVSLAVFVLTLFTIHYSLITTEVYAVCPICTVAVGAGLGLSRYLGIDDAVSSIWIGGLTLSMAFWLIDWVEKRKIKALTKPVFIKPFEGLFTDEELAIYSKSAVSVSIIILMYALVLIPLKYSGFIGQPLNTILGIDKIVFGTVIGSAAFIIGMWTDKKIRQVRGKQLFTYQKVVFPLISLVIGSLVVYYFGGYLY